VLGATTTCARVAEALRAGGFAEAGEIALHLWWPGQQGLPEPMLIGSNTRDTALNPYPERWWGDPEGAGPPGG
jgi:hypothetical protein